MAVAAESDQSIPEEGNPKPDTKPAEPQGKPSEVDEDISALETGEAVQATEDAEIAQIDASTAGRAVGAIKITLENLLEQTAEVSDDPQAKAVIDAAIADIKSEMGADTAPATESATDWAQFTTKTAKHLIASLRVGMVAARENMLELGIQQLQAPENAPYLRHIKQPVTMADIQKATKAVELVDVLYSIIGGNSALPNDITVIFPSSFEVITKAPGGDKQVDMSCGRCTWYGVFSGMPQRFIVSSVQPMEPGVEARVGEDEYANVLKAASDLWDRLHSAKKNLVACYAALQSRAIKDTNEDNDPAYLLLAELLNVSASRCLPESFQTVKDVWNYNSNL